MKRSLLIINFSFLVSTMYSYQPLNEAPDTIERFHEIAARCDDRIPALLNDLTPQERVFVYYLFRAGLPGNYILADQLHRDALRITRLFEHILDNANRIEAQQKTLSFDVEKFLEQVTTYLVYLWTNHAQYFMREQANSKRTPAKIGLHTITPENVVAVLKALGDDDAQKVVDDVSASIFDIDVDATIRVSDNIQASACNMYSPDFTEADYQLLSVEERSALNGYFYIDLVEGKRVPKMQPYKVGGKYSQELDVAVHWLRKAHEHAKRHPQQLDEHIVQSLEYLITFFETGDEEYFKKHSIEWLKTKSRIDYNFGFVEVYDDPKLFRGSFQADITIKSIDMEQLNAILPSLESQLPFPAEFKRQNLDDTAAIPNASINTMVFASGHLGPLSITAAYCLPNYAEIRANHGSKQIIYEAGKGLGAVLNAKLSRQLAHLPERAAWFEKHDPDNKLGADLWNVHVILHETLGHGSGKLDKHVFKEGEPLTIENVTYKVGDTIEVTSSNNNEFIGGYGSALEELRAEIIALYTSIFMFDELAAQDLYKDWPQKIGKDAMIECLIFDMMKTGLRRLLNHNPKSDTISGAHAQANYTIMNYILDHGGVELVEQKVVIDGTDYTVLDFRINDLEKTLKCVKELMILVQTIKSTGDGIGVQKLIDTYGTTVRNAKHATILQDNRKAVVGDLKVCARIFPRLALVRGEQGEALDVEATWPTGIVEQSREYAALAYSKE